MKLFSILMLISLASVPGYAEKKTTDESFDQASMSEDQLVSFFEGLKKGTPIQLTLTGGKIVKGLYGSYDDYYETVWIVPRGEPGVFAQKGMKISGIHYAAMWDRNAAAPSGEPGPLKDLSKSSAATSSSSPVPNPDTGGYYLLENEKLK
jgi:hypothetical protein